MTVDQILIAMRRAAENDYSLSVSSQEAAALVAEVERLRSINDDYLLEMGRQHALLRDQQRGENAERVDVVAWLREYAFDPETTGAEMRLLQNQATTIERGEHRREETK